eukprot:34727_1
MAAPSDAPHPKSSCFIDANQAQQFSCSVCLEAPMRFATTTGCGVSLHCLCKGCVDELHTSEHTKCPYCQGKIHKNKVETNNDKQTQILMLQMKCEHSGCDWKGMLIQWPAHYNDKHPASQPTDDPQPGAMNGNIQVKVKDINNAVKVIHCQATDTVKRLKDLFHIEHGIPMAQIRFAFHGKVLKDNQRFQDVGIVDDVTIHFLKKFK